MIKWCLLYALVDIFVPKRKRKKAKKKAQSLQNIESPLFPKKDFRADQLFFPVTK
jgi:hypothetical protein